MESRQLRVDMNDILDAMETFGDDVVCFFLDLETGKVESRLSPDAEDTLGEEDAELDQLFDENPDRFEEIRGTPGATSTI